MSALGFTVDWDGVSSQYAALTVKDHVVVGWGRVPRWDQQTEQWTSTDSRFASKALWTLPDFFEIDAKESLCVRPAPPRFTDVQGMIYDEISGPVLSLEVSHKAMHQFLDLLNLVVREGRE